MHAPTEVVMLIGFLLGLYDVHRFATGHSSVSKFTALSFGLMIGYNRDFCVGCIVLLAIAWVAGQIVGQYFAQPIPRRARFFP